MDSTNPLVFLGSEERKNRTASKHWANVDINELGKGFVVLDRPSEVKKTRVVKKVKRLNKFIKGKSPFIKIWIDVDLPKRKPKPKKKPLNESTTVSDKDKLKFLNSTNKHIKTVSTYMEEYVLPITSALNTAMLDTQERYSQIMEDSTSTLPVDFVLTKAEQAVRLVLCDMLSKLFKLSPENRQALKFPAAIKRPGQPNDQS